MAVVAPTPAVMAGAMKISSAARGSRPPTCSESRVFAALFYSAPTSPSVSPVSTNFAAPSEATSPNWKRRAAPLWEIPNVWNIYFILSLIF